MSEPVVVHCPSCSRQYRVDASMAGRKARCKQCGARFRITLYDPIVPDDPDAPAREQARQMMSKLSRLFESWVRERPEEWLCVGRRWTKETLRSVEARPQLKGAGSLQPGKPSGIDGLPTA